MHISSRARRKNLFLHVLGFDFGSERFFIFPVLRHKPTTGDVDRLETISLNSPSLQAMPQETARRASQMKHAGLRTKQNQLK